MNGGGAGPENALAPRAQPLIQEQPLPDELMIRLGLKTQQNRQTEEYARSFELFINAGAVPAPPDNTPVLSRAHFIAFATQHWPWGPAQAASSFAACDRDNSGRMNRHEFALLRRAFITCRPGDEHIPELVQIKSFADERLCVDPGSTERWSRLPLRAAPDSKGRSRSGGSSSPEALSRI